MTTLTPFLLAELGLLCVALGVVAPRRSAVEGGLVALGAGCVLLPQTIWIFLYH